MESKLLQVFLALGGTSIILGLLAKGVGPAVAAAVHWAIGENHPAARRIALAHRAWLEAQFKAVDDAADAALDKEAAAASTPPAAAAAAAKPAP